MTQMTDTTWELEQTGRAPDGNPRYRLTVRVRPPGARSEHTWTGWMALTRSGSVSLDRMELQQTAGQRGLIIPNTLTTWPIVKEFSGQVEALEAVALRCRQVSLQAEDDARSRVRGREEGARAIRKILAAGPQSI